MLLDHGFVHQGVARSLPSTFVHDKDVDFGRPAGTPWPRGAPGTNCVWEGPISDGPRDMGVDLGIQAAQDFMCLPLHLEFRLTSSA